MFQLSMFQGPVDFMEAGGVAVMAASPGLAEHEVQQALSGLQVDTLIACHDWKGLRWPYNKRHLCQGAT